MLESSLIFRAEDASKGGFAGIRKIEGDIVDITEEENPFQTDRVQAVVWMENVIIHEMVPGEAEPELQDDKFKFFYGLAKKGSKPSNRGMWVLGWLASAAKAGVDIETIIVNKTPVHAILEWTAIPLGFKDKQTGDEVEGHNFIFAGDEAVDTIDIWEYATSLMVDKSPGGASREIAMSGRTKRNEDITQAIKDKNWLLFGLELGDNNRLARVE